MRKEWGLFLFFALVWNFGFSFRTTWTNMLAEGSAALSLVRSKDGAIWVAGYQPDTSLFREPKACWMNLDSNGNILKTFFHATQTQISGQIARRILPLSNGKIWVVGRDLFGTGREWIALYNYEGRLLWKKDFDTEIQEITSLLSVGEDVILIGWANFGEIYSFLSRISSTGQVLWEKKYEKTWKNPLLREGIRLDDGSFLLVGEISGNGLDVFSLKIDEKGNILQERIYDSPKDQVTRGIFKTSLGDIVIYGSTETSGGDKDGYVLFVTPDGTKLGDKNIGTSADEEFLAFSEEGNRYQGAGWKKTTKTKQGWVVALDEKGEIRGEFLYEGPGDTMFTGIATDKNENSLVIGWSETPQKTKRLLILKIAKEALTKPTVSSPLPAFFSSLSFPLEDGSMLTLWYNTNNQRLFITRVKAQTILWQQVLDGFYQGHHAILLQDGSVLLAGWYIPPTRKDKDGWAIKFGDDGNVLWTQTYGKENQDDVITAIVLGNQKNYHLIGYTLTTTTLQTWKIEVSP